LMSTTERLLRPKEVCQRLGISYPTLARWVKEGKIRAVRTAGGKYRIPESEVRRIAEGLPVSKEVRAVIYARELPIPEKRPGGADPVPEAVLLLQGLQGR